MFHRMAVLGNERRISNMAYNYFNTGLSGLFSSSSGSNSFMNYSFISDYTSIRNGSYGKLLKAYYNKEGSGSSSKSNNASDKIFHKVADKSLTTIKGDVDALKTSANALVTKGNKSLFVEKDITTTAENGDKSTTKGYDTNAIMKAVKSFVSDYNRLLDSTSESDNSNILRKTLMMVQNTSSMSKSLEKVGITIGFDNKLSVDEDKLKSADITSVKNLFNGNSSFAYQTAQRAAMIGQDATRAATYANTYNKSAQYQYNNFYANGFNAYF